MSGTTSRCNFNCNGMVLRSRCCWSWYSELLLWFIDGHVCLRIAHDETMVDVLHSGEGPFVDADISDIIQVAECVVKQGNETEFATFMQHIALTCPEQVLALFRTAVHCRNVSRAVTILIIAFDFSIKLENKDLEKAVIDILQVAVDCDVDPVQVVFSLSDRPLLSLNSWVSMIPTLRNDANGLSNSRGATAVATLALRNLKVHESEILNMSRLSSCQLVETTVYQVVLNGDVPLTCYDTLNDYLLSRTEQWHVAAVHGGIRAVEMMPSPDIDLVGKVSAIWISFFRRLFSCTSEPRSIARMSHVASLFLNIVNVCGVSAPFVVIITDIISNGTPIALRKFLQTAPIKTCHCSLIIKIARARLSQLPSIRTTDYAMPEARVVGDETLTQFLRSDQQPLKYRKPFKSRNEANDFIHSTFSSKSRRRQIGALTKYASVHCCVEGREGDVYAVISKILLSRHEKERTALLNIIQTNETW